MIKEMLISLFYIILTLFLFIMSNKIYIKYKHTLLNPVIITTISVILLLILFDIPYSTYNKGGRIITYIMGPIVVVLAIPLYKNRNELLKNFIPIVGGIVAGIIAAFVSVIILCKVLNLDSAIMLSLLSKSITTPMAVESTKLLGGNEAITIIAVVITGQIGAIISPFIYKYGKIKSNIAKGIGLGSSAHAFGTTKAMEMGEDIGAASSLAIGVTGLLTIIFVIIFA
ncbi:LrgB family protein [Sedimentibacter sp. MB31-C6]|uniref:LrgB family protein n=1 Tax=Sedimentibacter sp. MB31-C6 TaxID=3109366 RepID=UPI002DDCAFBD|nr:LrgB family protein [Sedimentibacter sp. MB36-C1]WSI05446.1 LrgB family protein [Sedimentibacter sp. MB36-C1]